MASFAILISTSTVACKQNSAATPSFCGNGNIDQSLGEECDLGSNNNDAGTCSSHCRLARCGDGIVQQPEECELDSSQEIERRCSAKCTWELIPRHEGCHLDPAALRVAPSTGVEFYDNVLYVSSQPALSQTEEADLLKIQGIAAMRCAADQGRSGPVGLYTVRLTEHHDIDSLLAVRNKITVQLSRVHASLVVRRNFSNAREPSTDWKKFILSQGRSDVHAIERAYLYARAWEDGHRLTPVFTAIHDTGICTANGACAPASVRLDSTWDKVIIPGGSDPHLSAYEAILGYPLDGASDWEGHGTNVAIVAADPDDGKYSHVTGAGISLDVGNGIVAGLPGADHRIYSYVGPADLAIPGMSAGPDLTIHEFISMMSAGKNNVVASNHSYTRYLKDAIPPHTSNGNTVYLDREYKVPYYQVFSAYGDVLWVFSAGNDGADLAASQPLVDVKLYAGVGLSQGSPVSVPGNVVGVAALSLESEGPNAQLQLSNVSTRGPGIRLAARGYWTSWAAPVVTSAAALLAAVDSTPTAPGNVPGRGAALASLLETTGRAVPGTSARAIDVAAALLLNRALEPTDWLPFLSNRLVYAGQADLGEVRADSRWTGGQHDERSTWRFHRPANEIVVEDEGVESGKGLMKNFITKEECLQECSIANGSFSFESYQKSSEHWKPTIAATVDAVDRARTIPLLTLRRTAASIELSGRIDAQEPGIESGSGVALGDLNVATTYCFRITWDESSDPVTRIPLAIGGQTSSSTVRASLHNARLVGRIRARSEWNQNAAISIPTCDEDLGAGMDGPEFSSKLREWSCKVEPLFCDQNRDLQIREDGYDARMELSFADLECLTLSEGRKLDTSSTSVAVGDPVTGVLLGQMLTSVESIIDPSYMERPCRASAVGTLDWVSHNYSDYMGVPSPDFPRRMQFAINSTVPWDLRSGRFPVPLVYELVNEKNLDEWDPGVEMSDLLNPNSLGPSFLRRDWMFSNMKAVRPNQPTGAPLRLIDGIGFLPPKNSLFPIVEADVPPR